MLFLLFLFDVMTGLIPMHFICSLLMMCELLCTLNSLFPNIHCHLYYEFKIFVKHMSQLHLSTASVTNAITIKAKYSCLLPIRKLSKHFYSSESLSLMNTSQMKQINKCFKKKLHHSSRWLWNIWKFLQNQFEPSRFDCRLL